MTDQASSLREKVARIVDPHSWRRWPDEMPAPRGDIIAGQRRVRAPSLEIADLILNLPEIKAGIAEVEDGGVVVTMTMRGGGGGGGGDGGGGGTASPVLILWPTGHLEDPKPPEPGVVEELVVALKLVRDRFFPADQPERDRDLLWESVNAALSRTENRGDQ